MLKLKKGECRLHNLHISPGKSQAYFNHEAERKRKTAFT